MSRLPLYNPETGKPHDQEEVDREMELSLSGGKFPKASRPWSVRRDFRKATTPALKEELYGKLQGEVVALTQYMWSSSMPFGPQRPDGSYCRRVNGVYPKFQGREVELSSKGYPQCHPSDSPGCVAVPCMTGIFIVSLFTLSPAFSLPHLESLNSPPKQTPLLDPLPFSPDPRGGWHQLLL
jgi:hypothetical protein